MINTLHIKNIGIIDDLSIDLNEGFNVLTGETGAGKSILLGALGLLLGNKNESGTIHDESRSCIIEGEFATLVERELNDAEQTCEELIQLPDGLYESWISIQISKQSLVEDLTSRLSDNEELEIEFNRDEFRKYAEDKMNRMQEAKK